MCVGGGGWGAVCEGVCGGVVVELFVCVTCT